jgi:pyridoxal phosphate enzyme (YggS family)
VTAGSAPPEPDPTDIAALAAARDRVLERIAAACVRVGREPSEVTLVAVSKTVPVARVRAALAAGLTVLAENRVQDGAAKAELLPGATWHLVGPLQSNKARRAVEAFDVIESVDSLDLARRLDRLVREIRGLPIAGAVPDDRRLSVLLQVNVDGDPAKAGFGPDELAGAVPELLGLGALRVDGLMTIGRQVDQPDDARATFRALRELSVRLRAVEPRLGPALSMGMSDDYPIALEEGATIVRVGRALFGDRPPAVEPADQGAS